MSKVLIPLTDGFEDIEAVSVIDVLRRGGVEVITASCMAGPEVTSAHGIVMKADAPVDEAVKEEYDAIVLPGGPGTRSLLDCAPLVERLRVQQKNGGLLCAICAAPTVLTELGLVPSDVHLTCYPSCVMDLDRASANVPCVEDDGFITGQAPGSALLFALVVLKRLEGEGKAFKVARGMVTDVL